MLKFVLRVCYNEHSLSETNWSYPCEGAVNIQNGMNLVGIWVKFEINICDPAQQNQE